MLGCRRDRPARERHVGGALRQRQPIDIAITDGDRRSPASISRACQFPSVSPGERIGSSGAGRTVGSCEGDQLPGPPQNVRRTVPFLTHSTARRRSVLGLEVLGNDSQTYISGGSMVA